MNLARVSCRPGEEIALGKPLGHSLGRRTSQLGCSHDRITLVGSPLRPRSLVRAGVRRRSNHDSHMIDAILSKQILPELAQSNPAQQIAKTWTSLGPGSGFLRSRGLGQYLSGEGSDLCCKSVIDSGSSAGTTSDDKVPDSESGPKPDERIEDGSILTGDGSELRSTLRLVECAMFAATAGLAYFLSNLLRLEAYFGCFFPLPVVISSMRWGAAAGRKTMVATAMLLLVLSGPLKAASYLLMHGFVGLAMGAFWKWNLSWGLSIIGCTVVRCLGALGFVLLTSWLLRDNLLALITMNAHASLSYMLAALGINLVPSMPMIYVVFASLLVVNCGSFVFLLHVLYAIFLRRLGLSGSITVPGWVERAM
ncbi:hypothetical protein KC19_10G132000 [Ceratodon purpureus]|uniref:DUF2232 domain-containing protein n=1 Tax=Ceratodon purpureus TaxID=3225 RepID=A0A8T0GS95_CERPU|nr:hypothetical protein KC19_10G132000 [Ceratodon purpureus]